MYDHILGINSIHLQFFNQSHNIIYNVTWGKTIHLSFLDHFKSQPSYYLSVYQKTILKYILYQKYPQSNNLS